MSDIKINNKKIKKINKLITPKQLKETMPCDEETKTFILNTRDAVENIIKKKKLKKLFIFDPFSIQNK